MIFMHIDDFTEDIRKQHFGWMPSDVNIFVLNDFLQVSDVIGEHSVFGPYEKGEVTLFVDRDTEMHKIVSKLGCFKSNSEAQKAGWKKPIPKGYTHRLRVAKPPQQRFLYIFNPMTIDNKFTERFLWKDIANIQITLLPKMRKL